MKQQQRFIIALIASAAVLIFWNYAFPPVKPPQPDANANNQPVAQASPQPSSSATAQPTATATATATVKPTPREVAQSASPTPTPTPEIPPRKIHVVTPLYEAMFDTRGAVATSWIVKRVRRSDGSWRELHSAA